MIILSKIEYRFKLLLSGIYPVRSLENNQKVCMDCFKPRSNKKSSMCSKISSNKSKFYVLDYQNFSFKIFSIW